MQARQKPRSVGSATPGMCATCCHLPSSCLQRAGVQPLALPPPSTWACAAFPLLLLLLPAPLIVWLVCVCVIYQGHALALGVGAAG